MNDDTLTQLTANLIAAADALREAVQHLDAQHAALSEKVDRIVAAVDGAVSIQLADPAEPNPELQARVAELERDNASLKAASARQGRKTLSPLATTILAKQGLDDSAEFDSAALDRALAQLAPEQRIAVKAEMARAGMIE